MLSRSGETWRPSTSTSSPTFPITVTPAGSVARTRPRRKRAPPTPPERATTRVTFRTLEDRVQRFLDRLVEPEPASLPQPSLEVPAGFDDPSCVVVPFLLPMPDRFPFCPRLERSPV